MGQDWGDTHLGKMLLPGGVVGKTATVAFQQGYLDLRYTSHGQRLNFFEGLKVEC